MSGTDLTWLLQLTRMDAPALPMPWLLPLWLSLGWSMVLASAVALLGKAWPKRQRLAAAGAAALACWLAGPYMPAHWLGMAFQAPSITSVLLCAVFLRVQFSPSVPHSPRLGDGDLRWRLHLAMLGVVLGWVLALDAFAVLPIVVYAWGFSPAATAAVLFVSMLPWLCRRGERTMDLTLWVAPLAVLCFAALRLPTGNLWDALLDPWLWVALHLYAGSRLGFSKRRGRGPERLPR